MYKALLICAGLGSLSLAGCSSDKSGNGDGSQPPTECVDLSQLPTTPTISFQNDLMPIFGLSCIASSCHDPSAHKANLSLGDRSGYELRRSTNGWTIVKEFFFN